MTTYRAKQVCNKPGCNVLLPTHGYCAKHKKTKASHSKRFDKLKRAPGSAAFYGSYAWKKTRAAYKADNPFCAECLKQGIYNPVKVVDHHPIERQVLEARGDNPHAFKYLRSLCISCDRKKLKSYDKRHDENLHINDIKIRSL